MLRILSVLFVAGLFFTACSGTKTAATDTTDTMVVDPMVQLGRSYQLVQLNGVNLKARDFDKGLPTIMINPAAGTVNGMGGCNTFNTTATMPSNESRKKKDMVPTNRITFGTVAATKMACPNMNTETSYFQMLDSKEWTYQLQGDKLIMEDTNGATLVFSAR